MSHSDSKNNWVDVRFMMNHLPFADTKPRFLIGIDPDCDKSGYAWWDMDKQRYMDRGTIGFGQLMLGIQLLAPFRDKVGIVLSAGWLNKPANFQDPTVKGARRHKITIDIGRNHGYGQATRDFADHFNITCICIPPTVSKWTPQQLLQITGIEETNQDIIDAMQQVHDRRTWPMDIYNRKKKR